MTRKLYYEDSLVWEFEAPAAPVQQREGRACTVLAETWFYPTSGGQPHDLGTLGAARVVDVTDESDGVLHWLEGDPGPGPWKARIDGARRFDFMQQHTGQHILSAAFLEVANAPTVSFHLGAETATIDVSGAGALRIAAAEALANRVIREARPVRAFEVNPAEIPALGLRKPPAVEGRVRIVEVKDFDRSACGGTHVRHTGEVQLLKVLSFEKVRDNLRVEFVCGERALRDYASRHEALGRLGALFTTGAFEVESIVEKKQTEAVEQRKALERLEQELAGHEVAALDAAAVAAGAGRLLIRWLDGRSPVYLRAVSFGLQQRQGLVYLVGAPGEKPSWIAGHGPGVALDLREWWKSWTAAVGAKGGGKPDLLQGGGLGDFAPEAALDLARAGLTSALGG